MTQSESPRPTKEGMRKLVEQALHSLAIASIESSSGKGIWGYEYSDKARAALLSAIDAILADETMGVRMIAAERQRQVGVEGWTAEHDDKHNCQELALAAACYAWPAPRPVEVKKAWPWSREWWKPDAENRLRDLARAGALIAAEIDRTLRAFHRANTPKEKANAENPVFGER